MYCIDTMGMTH